MRPPADAGPTLPGSGPDAANGAGAGAGGAPVAGEEEELAEWDEEEEAAVAFVENKSQLCAGVNTCSKRSSWCAGVFKDGVPTDCLLNFKDYCCGMEAQSELETCKVEVDSMSEKEIPDEVLPLSCMDQSAIRGDKNKFDQCAACCTNKIDDC